nr:protein unc-93 homolog B1 isoform X2 [Zonotrichia albicollis]
MFCGYRAQRFRAWGCHVHGYTVLDVGVQGLGVLGMRVQGLCVQVTEMQNIWVQDFGCQQGPFHPDAIQGSPEALMEKDINGCQDGAKTEPSARLGTEGTETQVRPGEHPWGEAGVWWPSPSGDSCHHPQLDDFVGPHPDYNEEEEEQKYFRRKRLGVIKNVVAASLAGTLTYSVYLGLLEMQLILHYDETYREVKYSNIRLEDIDRKVLMGINVTPVAALLYTPILIRYGPATLPASMDHWQGTHTSSPCPGRFFGTKWAMFLAIGIYALFVSSNYWERYYTLVPSAVAIGMVIVPLWASMGTYIMRMAQKYYEYINYKEEQEKEKQRAPRDACNAYVIIFQTIFYSCFHLSFVCAQMPMVFFLNNYLYQLNHTLFAVRHCGEAAGGAQGGTGSPPLGINHGLCPTGRDPEPRHAAWFQQDGAAEPSPQRQPHHRGERLDGRRLPRHAGGAGAVRRGVPAHGGDRHAQHRLGQHLPAALQAHAGLSPAAPLPTVHLQWLRGALCLHGIFPELRRVRPRAGEAGVSSHGLRLLRLGVLQPGPVHAALAPAHPAPGWSPHPRCAPGDALLLGAGTPVPGAGTAALQHCRTLGHRQRPQQDRNQHPPGDVVQEKGAPRLHLHHLPLVAGPGYLRRLPVVRAAHEGKSQICPSPLERFQAFWGHTPTTIPKLRVPQAKLSIMLLTLVVAVGTYLWMERKVAWNMEVRLPRIPRPRHKTRGYRYLEDNSDETGSDGDGDKEDDDRHPTEATREDELPKEDGELLG